MKQKNERVANKMPGAAQSNKRVVRLPELLASTQAYISQNYASALKDNVDQLKSYIIKYLRNTGYIAIGMTIDETADRLYSEMAEYSIITPFLTRSDVEEININGWDDIAITYTDGRIEKMEEHFFSPTHAMDNIIRLLRHSKMVVDASIPKAEGHLPNNARIAAVINPIVDSTRGVSASIRLLHPSRITCDEIVSSGEATQEILDFLCLCLRYGVSFVVAGATSSGKTTLLNALLKTLPDFLRIYTIESGSRELDLIRYDENGKITNNVVHTLSRPSETEKQNISQEKLLETALRFDPNVIVVGEMRDTEAYSAVEASLTGHTVVSTIHATGAEMAHTRIALLCQKRYPIPFDTSLNQAAQAFPLIIYSHHMEDNSRKILNISECQVVEGRRIYRTLYQYDIDENKIVDGATTIEGHFTKVNCPSEYLEQRLIQFGAPRALVEKFRGEWHE